MAHRYTARSRHRVSRRGRTYYLGRRIHNPDWKLVGFAALVGVAGTVGAIYLQGNVGYFQQHWYALPAASLLAGVVLLGKMPIVGAGLVVLAGAWGYSAYQSQAASSKTTQGFTDAGAFYGMRRDSGAYEGMGALVGPQAMRMKFNQGAVGTLLGPRSRALRTNQGAVGALAGYGEAGRLGMD
jgi:hypothetical protein